MGKIWISHGIFYDHCLEVIFKLNYSIRLLRRVYFLTEEYQLIVSVISLSKSMLSSDFLPFFLILPYLSFIWFTHHCGQRRTIHLIVHHTSNNCGPSWLRNWHTAGPQQRHRRTNTQSTGRKIHFFHTPLRVIELPTVWLRSAHSYNGCIYENVIHCISSIFVFKSPEIYLSRWLCSY